MPNRTLDRGNVEGVGQVSLPSRPRGLGRRKSMLHWLEMAWLIVAMVRD